MTLVRKKKIAITTKQIYIISLRGNANMKMIMVQSLGEKEAGMYNDDNREWFCTEWKVLMIKCYITFLTEWFDGQVETVSVQNEL